MRYRQGVPLELRTSFHRELESIERSVNVLFALVAEGLSGATDALLAGDSEMARELADRDSEIDRLYAEVEAVVERQLCLQSPAASDLRFLLTMLRILPELERSGDLTEHIASRAVLGLGSSLSPRVRLLIQRMGEVGGSMWRELADAFVQRDAESAARLRVEDDQLDELHSSLSALLAAGELNMPATMEMTLVGRFYERLGDHAVNIAERIRQLAPRP
jgi:phosphate transport system protein